MSVHNQIPRPRQELARIKDYVPGKGTRDAIKLSSNENPLGTSPLALSVLKNHCEALHRYPDGSATQLRKLLAEKNGVSLDSVHVGNGADEIIREISSAYVNKGDVVLIPRHTFSEYRSASQIAGAHIVYINMTDGNIDLVHFASLLQKSPQIVFLCHPNNPTGTAVPSLQNVLESISTSTLVVVDQAYAEFANEGFEDIKGSLSRFPNLIVLHTFSKLYGLASLRIGVAYAQKHIIATLNKVKMPFNIGTVSQLAACAALQDELFVKDTLSVVQEGRTRLQKLCATLAIPYFNSDANFLCMHLGSLAKEFYSFCTDHNLYVRYLASFDMPEYIRVSIGTNDELDVFIALLKRWHTEQAFSDN